MSLLPNIGSFGMIVDVGEIIDLRVMIVCGTNACAERAIVNTAVK